MHRSIPRRTARSVGVFAGLLLLIGLVVAPTHAASPSAPAHVAVSFSPQGGATEAVISELNRAQTQVWMQAYSFTSAPIAKALVEAHKRGVNILAVLDKSNETDKYSAATFLNNAGIQPPTNAFSMNCCMKVMARSPLCLWRVGCRYSRILDAGLEGFMPGFWHACAGGAG